MMVPARSFERHHHNFDRGSGFRSGTASRRMPIKAGASTITFDAYLWSFVGGKPIQESLANDGQGTRANCGIRCDEP
jgi:hypothetical protein